MPFVRGRSGNPRGRPRGSLNKAKVLVKELAATICTDLQVQQRMLQQARDGTLHPSLMTAFMHYYAGRPPARLEVSSAPLQAGSRELAEQLRENLSKDERLDLARLLAKARGASAADDAPPAPTRS